MSDHVPEGQSSIGNCAIAQFTIKFLHALFDYIQDYNLQGTALHWSIIKYKQESW